MSLFKMSEAQYQHLAEIVTRAANLLCSAKSQGKRDAGYEMARLLPKLEACRVLDPDAPGSTDNDAALDKDSNVSMEAQAARVAPVIGMGDMAGLIRWLIEGINQLRDQVDRAHSQRFAVEKELKEMHYYLQQANSDVHAWQQKFNRSEQDYKELEATVVNDRNELAKTQAHRDQLHERITELTEQLAKANKTKNPWPDRSLEAAVAQSPADSRVMPMDAPELPDMLPVFNQHPEHTAPGQTWERDGQQCTVVQDDVWAMRENMDALYDQAFMDVYNNPPEVTKAYPQGRSVRPGFMSKATTKLATDKPLVSNATCCVLVYLTSTSAHYLVPVEYLYRAWKHVDKETPAQ